MRLRCPAGTATKQLLNYVRQYHFPERKWRASVPEEFTVWALLNWLSELNGRQLGKDS